MSKCGKEIMDVKFKTVREAVCAHTGMTVEELLNDTKEYHINGVEQAAHALLKAAPKRTPIYIFGDYDVDGISASSILALALKEIGAHVFVRLPRRFSEGYGIQKKVVDIFKPNSILITVDNGIKAFEAFAAAKEKDIYTILTDHHLPDTDKNGNPVWPDADIVIDPNAVPGSADFNGYCGAGIAYKIAVEILGKDHKLVPKLKSLAAIATIADSVPLVYENRRIVKEGLKTLLTEGGTTAGLRSLLQHFDCQDYIDEVIIGYKIAPAINAPARLFDAGAMASFKLLTFDGDKHEAFDLASRQKSYNSARKSATDEWTPKIVSNVEKNGLENDAPIIVYEPDIPEGIVGIVVGRLAERYQCPCILFAKTEKEGVIKGSGRSFGNVNLKDMLDHVSSLLLSYGGHAAAAGVSIEEKNLDSIRKLLKEYFQALPEEIKNPPVDDTCDLSVKPDDMGQVFEEILSLAPYGEGNPALRLNMEGLRLEPVGNSCYRQIGEAGVRLYLPNQAEAVSFALYNEYVDAGFPTYVDLTGTFSINYFNGVKKHQIIFDSVKEHNGTRKKTLMEQKLSERASSRYGKNP